MKTLKNLNRQLTRCGRAENGQNRDLSVHYHNRTPQKRAEESRNQVLLLGVLIVVVGLLGALVWDYVQREEIKGTEHNAVLAVTIFIQAMLAFFGLLNLEESHQKKVSPLTKGGMRCAIAGALVVTYLFLVIFHCIVEFTGGSSPRTDSLVDHFAWIVGLTIAFYFASETGIHAMNLFKPERKPHYISRNGSTSETRSTPR